MASPKQPVRLCSSWISFPAVFGGTRIMIFVLVYTGGEIQYGGTGAEYSIPPKITFPATESTTFEDVKSEIYRGLEYSKGEYSITIQARYDARASGPHFFQLVPLYEARTWQMIFGMTSAQSNWCMVELYVKVTSADNGLSQNVNVNGMASSNNLPAADTPAAGNIENVPVVHESQVDQSLVHFIFPQTNQEHCENKFIVTSSLNGLSPRNEVQTNVEEEAYVGNERDNGGNVIEEMGDDNEDEDEDEYDTDDDSDETEVDRLNENPLDRQLLAAAKSGDARSMQQLASDDPGVLLGTTPQGNTCLHISCIHGHERFCMDVVALDRSLLAAVNVDGETPLLNAVANGHVSLASVLLMCYRDQQLNEAILKQDKRRCNVLHHAIRSGHRELALELVAAEPALSQAVNKYDESPMFMAVMRNFGDVLEKLLEIPYSAYGGAFGYNALHAAVRNGNPVIANRVMETRPWLARQETKGKLTPMHLAVLCDKTVVLTALLERDGSLGYLFTTNGVPLLCIAAVGGHVVVARELLEHCPDAPYWDIAKGATCLHIAVEYGQTEFVDFVLGSQQLRKLVNVPDKRGKTALHLAVNKCNTKLVTALLHHPDIDVMVLNNKGQLAISKLSAAADHTKTANWMVAGTATNSSPGGALMMDSRLLEAATSGDATSMNHLDLHDPGVLLGITPRGDTCLHISSIHGHERFCKDVLALNPSLLTAINTDDETPLLIAVTSGYVSLASVLLRCCRDQQLSKAILKQDKNGCNALHHAIRSGHRELALELIVAEPTLSRAVNKCSESPMFIAVMRGFTDVFEKLLEIPDSAHSGASGNNALHAAVRNGNSVIAKRIMETRPGLAWKENNRKSTPAHVAVIEDKIDVLRVLLEHDWSLGYVVSTDGSPLLVSAALWGLVGVAQELLNHCPNAPYCVENNDSTCLHHAVWRDQTEFVEFILGTPQLRKLVNMRDSKRITALHLAVIRCNPKMVATLLLHQDIDVTVLDDFGNPASCVLPGTADNGKSLNWNEVSMLMLKSDPENTASIYNLHKLVKDKAIDASRKDVKSLTQTYISNTSLVAILIATITFAAAFTLPGGYSSDAGSQGLPIMARKFAFQAFMISDTLAMCSSVSVAFICIRARWGDLEFLLYYISFTKKLMWFAYMATTTAFATGLYTVLAPCLPRLAIAICVLSILLPILTLLLGEWPVLKLRFRLREAFKSDLLYMD